MHRGRRFGVMVLVMPVVIAVIAGVLALAVRGLWNGVLTEVVSVKAITYWQALGLLVLARILVGGFPRPGGGRFGPGGRQMMMQKWASLTPEQREKLRAGMGRRGCWGPPWEGPADGAGPGEAGKAGEGGAAKV